MKFHFHWKGTEGAHLPEHKVTVEGNDPKKVYETEVEPNHPLIEVISSDEAAPSQPVQEQPTQETEKKEEPGEETKENI